MSAILKQKLIDIANGFTKYGLWKGGGSETLSELKDVTLTNLKTNDVLTYNGNEWMNDDNLQTQINTLNSNLLTEIGKKASIYNYSEYSAFELTNGNITLAISYWDNTMSIKNNGTLVAKFQLTRL